MRRRPRSASCPSSARRVRTSSRAGPARLLSSPGPTDKQGAARDASPALRERAALQRVRRERADSRAEQRAFRRRGKEQGRRLGLRRGDYGGRRADEEERRRAPAREPAQRSQELGGRAVITGGPGRLDGELLR